MSKEGDYTRADEYLGDHEDDIELEYGEPYEDLEPQDQRQAILDIFFKGQPEYTGSAEQLREGLAYARGTGEYTVRVDQITRRGKTYTIIRDTETGRIRQWVKE